MSSKRGVNCKILQIEDQGVVQTYPSNGSIRYLGEVKGSSKKIRKV